MQWSQGDSLFPASGHLSTFVRLSPDTGLASWLALLRKILKVPQDIYFQGSYSWYQHLQKYVGSMTMWPRLTVHCFDCVDPIIYFHTLRNSMLQQNPFTVLKASIYLVLHKYISYFFLVGVINPFHSREVLYRQFLLEELFHLYYFWFRSIV